MFKALPAREDQERMAPLAPAPALERLQAAKPQEGRREP
jgi:hypothetical protein